MHNGNKMEPRKRRLGASIAAVVCALGLVATATILTTYRSQPDSIHRHLLQEDVTEEVAVQEDAEEDAAEDVMENVAEDVIEEEMEDIEIISATVAENPDDEFYIQQIRERLMPRDLECGPEGGPTRQFAHLHHMKTGGTSLNKAIRCSLERAQKTHNARINYVSLSECKWSRFQRCMTGEDETCRNGINQAMVMQYCAPLFAVNHFDWLDADLVTMLRHPVDRVWSMYRFQTKSCYKCHPLLEAYQRIENGTTYEICGLCEGVCMTQLSNHLVRNLCTTDPAEREMTDQEMLEEAIYNMKHRVALVGVTEDLNTTHAMLGKVFPWLNTTVEGSDLECPLPFANSSPKNNRCGPNDSHMDLPSHPDEETKEMILKHNQLDLQLYEEARKWFELEKIALGFADI